MNQFFLLISNILVIFAFLVYIWAISKGKAKPHRTTRLVIFLLASIGTLSLFVQGSATALWLIGLSAFFSLIILILSFKYGMGGWSKLDIVCLGIALLGIIIWRITNNPALALYSVIIADFVGFVPTIVKTYHHPQTESWHFFFIGIFASGFNLLAIQKWTFNEYSYPLYLVIIEAFMVCLILRLTFQKLFKK